MTIRYRHVNEYHAKFDKFLPTLYINHLSDDAFDALLAKAIADNKPIEPSELSWIKNLPKDAYL